MEKNTYLIKIVLAIFIINLAISFFFYKAKSATTGKDSFYLYFDENKVEYISGKENTNVLQNELIHVWYDKEAGTDSTKNNSDLKDLRIDIEGIVPSFDKNILNYDLVIGNEINQIEVLAITENPNSTVNVSENTNLVEGLNTIKIEVISEDKTNVKNCNIQVTKTANAKLANTNLETLAIENATLNKPFENTTTRYETEVSKDTQSLRILAIPENEGATVEISGKDDLQEGNNLVFVTVTAQNGFTKRQYEINVYKRNEEEEEKYNQEQQENKNNLEQIYEAQKTSVIEESDNGQKENIETKQMWQKWIVLILTVIIIFIIITIVKIIKKKRGRK